VAFASVLSRWGRLYIWTVVAVGLAVIVQSSEHFYQTPIAPQWVLLAVLTLISGSASVYLPWAHVSISISEAFVFTAVLLYGAEAGTLTVALDGLVLSFWVAKRRPEIDRAVFNFCAPAASAWISAKLFFLISGIAPLVEKPASLNEILPALFVFSVAYFGINSWLIAFVIALEKKLNPWDVWRKGFVWLSLNYFCGASVAVLLVGYNRSIDLRFVGVVVPLLLVLYFTFKTSTDRVADANRHVEQLNTLYLSTIETLAMAIDAKDQITHGHIRRVQTYAVGLAAHVGVVEEHLIKAIEAAALLHDMGKLAVPEYILNKPGKLTAVEFEKMKLHASVGADILSAIAFPYPVVPIVRHHHENWDGTGYPTGIKGTEIPIGARILSVVDCFDALTSDRPYRPRLSDDEALKILVERRGSMYDPLIVDTFIRVHTDIAPKNVKSPDRREVNDIPNERHATVQPPTSLRLDDIAASADEMLTLYELARALAGRVGPEEIAGIIATHMRRLIPSSLCVFFAFDSRTDEIEAKHAVGEASSMVKGLRIGLGQRLSGWVAANRQTIVNSDPVLDLGEIARSAVPRLRSCVSTPLLFEDDLIGVLSLYSTMPDGFTDDHRRVIEVVASHIAHLFRRAGVIEERDGVDPLAALPSILDLQQFVIAARIQQLTRTSGLTMLLIGVVELRGLTGIQGRGLGDEALRHVVQHTQSELRSADLLFRYGAHELVVLLNDTNSDTGDTIAMRVRTNLRENPLLSRTGAPMIIRIETVSASAPQDGESLADLLVSARLRSSVSTSDSTVH
jgi:diguanylate cyclase (GGDEF)-like protein/putative nucleotidyltransferase with HDIG domain